MTPSVNNFNNKLHSVERYISIFKKQRLSIKICTSNRAISTDEVGVIIGVPPMKWHILETQERYESITKADAYENLINSFKVQWNNPPYASWTYQLIHETELKDHMAKFNTIQCRHSPAMVILESIYSNLL